MVNLNKLTISLVLFVLLLANIAFAVGENIEFVDSKVSIDVSYRNFGEDQDTINVGGQFTLKNNLGSDTSGLKAVFEFLTGLPTGSTGYNANDVTTDLLASETKTFSFTVNVPHKQDSGEEKIGSIIIKNAEGTELKKIDLFQNTKSMLELNDFEVDYVSEDNNRESDSFDGESTDAIFKLQENLLR